MELEVRIMWCFGITQSRVVIRREYRSYEYRLNFFVKYDFFLKLNRRIWMTGEGKVSYILNGSSLHMSECGVEMGEL